jgi:hypothetical protein
MKKKLLASLLALVGSGVMAQSAFQGFYGQVGTGYESNQVGSTTGTKTESSPANGTTDPISAPSQSFGGAPLVLGLGYNFSVAPKWVLGIGGDYSFLSQTSSTFGVTTRGADFTAAGFPAGVTSNGLQVKTSNRFNIFFTPGYAIDKDKLVYLKAGYSSVNTELTAPNTFILGGRTFTNAQLGSSSGSNQSKTVSGYIVGLGYKQIIQGGLYGFAEANYMSYGNVTNSVTQSYLPGSGSAGTFTSNTSASLNTYNLLVGVGYKF